MTDDERFEHLELDWKGRTPRGQQPGPTSSPEPSPGQPAPPAGAAHRGAPGSTQGMSEGLQLALAPLFTDPVLTVRQFRERLDTLVGWDQPNTYEVSGVDGRPIFWAAEQPRGVLGALSRNFNPFHRNTTDCLTADGTVALRVDFPFSPFLRRAEVTGWDGRALGRVRQRLSLWRSRLDVLGLTDNVLLEIHGPAFKLFSFTPWVFEVRHRGLPVAAIRRHWAGWFQELFTRADTFTIEFSPGFVDPRLRQLLVAAALTIDLVQFERPKQHGGGVLPRLLE